MTNTYFLITAPDSGPALVLTTVFEGPRDQATLRSMHGDANVHRWSGDSETIRETGFAYYGSLREYLATFHLQIVDEQPTIATALARGVAHPATAQSSSAPSQRPSRNLGIPADKRDDGTFFVSIPGKVFELGGGDMDEVAEQEGWPEPERNRKGKGWTISYVCDSKQDAMLIASYIFHLVDQLTGIEKHLTNKAAERMFAQIEAQR